MTQTDAEKLQIAIDHIIKCHDAMDDVTKTFREAFRAKNGDGDYVVGPHKWYAMHVMINGHFPSRPTIPTNYLEQKS